VTRRGPNHVATDHRDRRAVFLDRDGVINRPVVRDGKPYPPGGIDDLEVLPGVPQALARLREAGFRLVVVTNQPDVARGTERKAIVEAMNERLRAALPIDEFRVCFHDDEDGCECRKPKPGLLIAAAREGNLRLEASFMVGDRWRDIEAGRNAGCMTVFVDWGYDERRPEQADVTVKSLTEAVDWILSRHESGSSRG
jgi:D-glycero-D-manno-heptose 1,7-bisphosphate phosphatase